MPQLDSRKRNGIKISGQAKKDRPLNTLTYTCLKAKLI